MFSKLIGSDLNSLFLYFFLCHLFTILLNLKNLNSCIHTKNWKYKYIKKRQRTSIKTLKVKWEKFKHWYLRLSSHTVTKVVSEFESQLFGVKTEHDFQRSSGKNTNYQGMHRNVYHFMVTVIAIIIIMEYYYVTVTILHRLYALTHLILATP